MSVGVLCCFGNVKIDVLGVIRKTEFFLVQFPGLVHVRKSLELWQNADEKPYFRLRNALFWPYFSLILVPYQ